MGRLLKTKKINGVEHYKFFSTISDSNINDKWLTESEMLNFMFWERFRKFLEDFTSDSITFPQGYFNKSGTMLSSNDSEYKSPAELKLLFFKDEDFFLKKLREQFFKINITMEVKDLEYGFSNKPKESKVIVDGFDYFDVIEFDGLQIELQTTAEGGTFFTCFAISPLDYREKHPTKAGARIYVVDNYTNFDIFDDYGHKSVVKIHNSLYEVIKKAVNNLTKQKLILT